MRKVRAVVGWARGLLIPINAAEDRVAAGAVGKVQDRRRTEGGGGGGGGLGMYSPSTSICSLARTGISIGRPLGSVAVWTFMATSTLVVSTMAAL